MPSNSESFDQLLARARGGDDAAMADLVRQYEPELRMVARLRLGPALRPYLDSMDLVQSVHRSILVGLRDNKFELTQPGQLIALALTIVRRKAARQWQRLQRQQRDSGMGKAGDSLPDMLVGLSSPGPDPAQAAEYRDAVERLCRDLDDLDRTLLEMNLQGYRTVEIARQLNLDADHLRVRLSRLRARLRASGVAEEWL